MLSARIKGLDEGTMYIKHLLAWTHTIDNFFKTPFAFMALLYLLLSIMDGE